MAVLCAGLALSSIHPSSEQVNREGQSLSLKKFGVTAEKCLAEYGLDSHDEQSQIAYVTFKDSQGAETAVLLST
ncbi:RNA-binding (RRM/RBD/RNP motifs) family protein [Trifolium repens]|nr:RNA-binding (RRM/RBD/RNP motifs) family protein [Trifolium repens]